MDERAGCSATRDKGLDGRERLRGESLEPPSASAPSALALLPSHLLVFPFVMGNVHQSSPYQADMDHESQARGSQAAACIGVRAAPVQQ